MSYPQNEIPKFLHRRELRRQNEEEKSLWKERKLNFFLENNSYSREDLKRVVVEEGITEVAKEIEISTDSLRKFLKEFGMPLDNNKPLSLKVIEKIEADRKEGLSLYTVYMKYHSEVGIKQLREYFKDSSKHDNETLRQLYKKCWPAPKEQIGKRYYR